MSEHAAFRSEARHVITAWLALLVLMFGSLASAHVPLGHWNVVIGLVIATVKAGIVVWWFMQLRRAGALLRSVACAGLFMMALLFGLGGLDYATRSAAPADVQPPAQLPPLRSGPAPR